MLVNGAATAHSWYPHECCSENDCYPVPCAELVLTPEGDVRWKGVLYFRRRMVRLSLDEQCHVCVEEGLGASVLSAAVRFRPTRDELSAKAVSRTGYLRASQPDRQSAHNPIAVG
jgi:hypothetical protein